MWRSSRRWLVVVGLTAAVAACDDDSSPAPNGGSGGGGAGGAAGRTGDGGAGASGAGGGGAGGAAGAAGAGGSAGDAGVNLCVKGPVELYCDLECPTYAEARGYASRIFALSAKLIIERPCTGLDGSELLSVGADYGSATQVFVYDAETQALIGVHFTDDTGDCYPDEVEGPLNHFPGWYGEAAPDCEFAVPPACEALDAGISAPDGLDAGADAGPPQCILTD